MDFYSEENIEQEFKKISNDLELLNFKDHPELVVKILYKFINKNWENNNQKYRYNSYGTYAYFYIDLDQTLTAMVKFSQKQISFWVENNTVISHGYFLMTTLC